MRTAVCVLTALAMLAALAAPELAYKRRRTIDINEAYNRTICSIVPVIDESKDRMPPRIMTWKCAADPNAYCRNIGLPDNLCCKHYHDTLLFECVEIFDTATVAFPERELDIVRYKWTRMQVPVGCVCGVSESTQAGDLPHSPDRRRRLPGPVRL